MQTYILIGFGVTWCISMICKTRVDERHPLYQCSSSNHWELAAYRGEVDCDWPVYHPWVYRVWNPKATDQVDSWGWTSLLHHQPQLADDWGGQETTHHQHPADWGWRLHMCGHQCSWKCNQGIPAQSARCVILLVSVVFLFNILFSAWYFSGWFLYQIMLLSWHICYVD